MLNLVLWIKGSSAAIPFTTLIALLALWFGISVPLTFVGAYFGFRRRVGCCDFCGGGGGGGFCYGGGGCLSDVPVSSMVGG